MLPSPPKTDTAFWDKVQSTAKDLKCDGCTLATEAFQECCLCHDIEYRLGCDVEGNPTTREEADIRFRQCMQNRSIFGRFSPMAAWRFAAVRLFGGFFKRKK